MWRSAIRMLCQSQWRVRDVDEIELLFVLPRAAVRKIMYFAQPHYQFLHFRNEASQKFMCHTGTVSCFIRNKAETLVTLHVVSTQLYYKRRYGTLSSIPVDALDLLFILDSKRVIFGEVGDNYRLSGL